MISALRDVFAHISPRRRRQLIPVLSLMLLGAFAELLSIGAILPFLAVIADPKQSPAIGPLKPVMLALGIDRPWEIVAAAASVFGLSAILAGAIRLLLVWVSQNFVFGIAKELSIAVYSRTLHQPYSYHTSLNSSEVLAAINKTQLITTQLLVPLMQAAIASFIAIFILVGLILIDPLVAASSGIGLAVIYAFVMMTTRKVMRRNGVVIAKAQGERLQAANEGLGGIRDVLLDHSQSVFLSRFERVETRLRRAQAVSNFVGQTPRFIVEALGLVLIAGLAFALSMREGGIVAALPLLGALALGAQRLVPLMQQIYAGWAQSLASGRMLYDILDILLLPEVKYSSTRDVEALFPFERDIVLQSVDFTFPGSEHPVIEDVNVTIPKGARVGIVGKTGSGKSTLMDLLLGLLKPTRGRILIDGIELSDESRPAWQAQIAHVPQAIYLADATIAENIAFGVPPDQIDNERVRKAASHAELSEVIEALPARYDTLVGERGIRLSGGQRQRIGIARALYKKANVLVFDEATSALDSGTEESVMKSIESFDHRITIFVVAHRTNTLDKCTHFLTLCDGSVSLV